ncbi:MAG: UvrD-helicase domain-containing protein, partial [Gammaproteobacteria bacterium]
MRYYADLHIHSKYSRATSKDCDLENLTYWGRKKGITVIGTGDFTHPAWIGEIKDKLVPAEPGLFRLRDDIDKDVSQRLPPSCHGTTRFMLSVEISTIYKKGEKTRKIHHLIYAPTIEKAEQISRRLEKIGNIRSDGRPILGLDSRHLLEIVLETGDDCYLVPAHIWTPWFAVLGSKSGFDSITECYGDLAEHIFAVETGLSSDPEMNRRISGLDRYRLVSNSDAHSPPKLGREACMFDTDLDYFALRRALETGVGYGGTVEFFPEEGKYHMDGHRKCGVCLSPEESRALEGLCPVCKKPLTLGVLYRINELSDRPESVAQKDMDDFVSLIPLPEMLSETEQVGAASKRVRKEYDGLLDKLGAELDILNDMPLDEIQSKAPSSLIPEAIARMREGNVIREPGFDGEYGRIRLFNENELTRHGRSSLLFDFADDKNDKAPDTPKPAGKQSRPATRHDKNLAVPAPLTLARQTPQTMGLDVEQRKALEIIDGPVLIVAGPGSGKTRVLTHRVAHLIAEHEVSPRQCLTITFTRRAAEEMRARLEDLLPNQWQDIPVTTFHALGLSILQENRVAAGLPRGFRVTNEAERQALLKEACGVSARKADRILKAVSTLKRTRRPPPAGAELATARLALKKKKENEGWIDYDDLMTLTLELLESDPGLCALYRERYSHVSIDEYQDIDELQYRLIRALAPLDGNVCAIGDPDQAIYAFRGADVAFFLRFQQDFPGARRVQLTRNYRSGQSIVAASSQMITPSTLVEDR